jgi:hypothetical protein
LRLAVAPGALRWRRGLAIRGLEVLPMSIVRWEKGVPRKIEPNRLMASRI